MAAQPDARRARPFLFLFLAAGIIFIAVAAAYTLLNIADNFFSFSLIQIFWMGVFLLVIGALLWLWVGRARNPRRTIGWLVFLVGIGGILLAFALPLLRVASDLLTFDLSQVLLMGILWAVIGVILLLTAGSAEPAPMARPASTPRSAPPPPKAPSFSAQPAPKAAAPQPPPPRVVSAPPGQVKTPPSTQARTPPLGTQAPAPRGAAPRRPDDLTIIEGIGPKVAEALNRAGITSFVQLARMTPDDLYRIVKFEQNVKLVGDTRTWPRQAQYLVEGDLDGFKRYVEQLIASRDAGPNPPRR